MYLVVSYKTNHCNLKLSKSTLYLIIQSPQSIWYLDWNSGTSFLKGLNFLNDTTSSEMISDATDPLEMFPLILGGNTDTVT